MSRNNSPEPVDWKAIKGVEGGDAQSFIGEILDLEKRIKELERVAEAALEARSQLEDAIAHNCNATPTDSAGWTQEDYDAWDAAEKGLAEALAAAGYGELPETTEDNQ